MSETIERCRELGSGLLVACHCLPSGPLKRYESLLAAGGVGQGSEHQHRVALLLPSDGDIPAFRVGEDLSGQLGSPPQPESA